MVMRHFQWEPVRPEALGKLMSVSRARFPQQWNSKVCAAVTVYSSDKEGKKFNQAGLCLSPSSCLWSHPLQRHSPPTSPFIWWAWLRGAGQVWGQGSWRCRADDPEVTRRKNMHALHSQAVMEEAWSIVGGNCSRISGVDSKPASRGVKLLSDIYNYNINTTHNLKVHIYWIILNKSQFNMKSLDFIDSKSVSDGQEEQMMSNRPEKKKKVFLVVATGQHVFTSCFMKQD